MSRTVRTASGVPLPLLEILLGGAGWVAGSLGLATGNGTGGGTLVMAAGLLATGWAVVAVRRRAGITARLAGPERARALRIGFVVAGVLLALVVGLPLVGGGWGELTVPLGCAVIGVGLVPLSSLLGERSLVAVGGVLVVLGAVGVLLALDSSGSTVPFAVVGFGGALVLWLAAARRIGLLGELAQRVSRS